MGACLLAGWQRTSRTFLQGVENGMCLYSISGSMGRSVVFLLAAERLTFTLTLPGTRLAQGHLANNCRVTACLARFVCPHFLCWFWNAADCLFTSSLLQSLDFSLPSKLSEKFNSTTSHLCSSLPHSSCSFSPFLQRVVSRLGS